MVTIGTCKTSHYAHRANGRLTRPSRNCSSSRLSGINHLFFPKISVPSDPLNLGWNVAVCAECTALEGVLVRGWVGWGGTWIITIDNSFSRSVDVDM